MDFWGIFFFFVSVFIGALALTLGYKRLAVGLGLYDVPNHRSSHSTPVPIGAGVVFLLCSAPAMVILQYFKIISFNTCKLFLCGTLLCTLLGFVDDIKPLSAMKRLSVQFFLALWVILELTQYLEISFEVKFIPINSVIVSVLFGVLFVMWMVNLFNFMDGMDGFLGSQSSLFALGSAGLCYYSGNLGLAYAYLVLLAVLLAFLVFNWRPAKLFMGDAGAYFLGFSFALLGLVGKVELEQSLVAQVILMAVVISDATLTLLVRLYTTHRMFQGHRTHGFQKLKIQKEMRGSRIIGLYSLLGFAWCMPLSFLAVTYPQLSVLFCLIAYLPILAFFAKLKVGIES